jgi:LemA protein
MSAREKMVNGKTNKERVDGHKELSTGLGGLLAVGESYPELKSNENFIQSQTRLSDLEERLAEGVNSIMLVLIFTILEFNKFPMSF